MRSTGLRGLLICVTTSLSLLLYSILIRKITMPLKISDGIKPNSFPFAGARLFVGKPSSSSIVAVSFVKITARPSFFLFGCSGLQLCHVSLGVMPQPLGAILAAGFQTDTIVENLT